MLIQLNFFPAKLLIRGNKNIKRPIVSGDNHLSFFFSDREQQMFSAETN